ncbi:hypothetical protein O3P69_014128 [Scylla paramamosain]|uniref:Uncharacterized protein n=1 Tax=Scylla paramamosain TaxID=85552 RepID=A0AAW0SGH7_SCYPA
MPPAKAKKPATPGKKEEKGEAKKPLQEKKPENAPAKAKKEGAPKPAPKKKDPAAKPAAGADAGKGKDKTKKRKLNETTTAGKPKPASTDAKKKKVEKKVEGKAGGAAPKGKKPVKKQLAPKVKTQKKRFRRRKPARAGKQEIVVYEGRRYFLLPSGRMRAMLDVNLEENDKIAKVDGTFIKKTDVKAFEEYKESIKSLPATTVKRKLKLKLVILRRNMMRDVLKEARATNKPSLATAKDAGREVQVMTMFRNTWVRKKAVPRLMTFIRNKTIKIKAVRKGKGPKELTEAEQKTLQRYTRKILLEENLKLRQALLSKRPSVAEKQKSAAKPQKKPAKKSAPSKAAPSKAGADKKQKRPAKKAAN